jgi:tetratricopeptide (TPR) repeat protein
MKKTKQQHNIALIYKRKGDYQKAISYLKKAIEISERYGDYHELAIKLLNLGDTYTQTKDFKQAEQNLTEGLKRILKVVDKYWEAHAYKYLGWLYRDKDDIKKARDYLTKAYNLFNSIGAKNEAQSAMFSLNTLPALDDIKEVPKKSK